MTNAKERSPAPALLWLVFLQPTTQPSLAFIARHYFSNIKIKSLVSSGGGGGGGLSLNFF